MRLKQVAAPCDAGTERCRLAQLEAIVRRRLRAWSSSARAHSPPVTLGFVSGMRMSSLLGR